MSRVTAVAAALLLLTSGLAHAAAPTEPLVLQLNAPASFRFAGYYAALWQGFYKDEGLSVSIKPGPEPGQPAIDPVREIADGRAQFGTGTAQLVIRAAQGLPVVVLAQIFQRSGAAIYYRSDTDFSSRAALAKARIGRLPASDILDIELATALRAENIDAAKVKTVALETGQTAAALADRRIDAAIDFPWLVPWQAYELGFTVKSFNPANYRAEFYGDNLFTLDRVVNADPQTVRKFRTASLRGWEYALQHPAEIEARMLAERPSPIPVKDAVGFMRYQGDVALRLSRYPDIHLGAANAGRWTEIETAMRGAGALAQTTDLAGFLYDPDAPLRTGNSGNTWRLAVGIVGAMILLAGVGIWWIGARRPYPRTADAPRPAAATPLAAPAVPRPAPATPPPAAEPVRPTPVAARPSSPARTAPALTASPSPPEPPPTDLNTVLTPLDRAIRRRVRGKVRFRLSLLPELWLCRTDPGPVAAIVLDLVQAAVDVMDADGSLIVGTRNFAFDENNLADHPGGRLGQFARITVRDSGPALTDAEFDQILDPERSTRPALARAGEAMHKLGGFARVESAEGVGTAVHLYFARVKDETGKGAATAAAAK